ncbi:MAG TPA: SRPBCC family protein [Lacipirellulaceae bacterium]|nr:SRPBCC family protein [Lacipirellulaceae bacterium]
MEEFPQHRAGVEVSRYRSQPVSAVKRIQNVGNAERAVSIAAGAGLGLAGMARGGLRGLALGALGAGLAWRGLTGHCSCYAALGINRAKRKPSTAIPARHGCKFEKTIVVSRRPDELYRFWRRLENLPQVMRHVKRISAVDAQRSHWVADGALGREVEWDAEIINERANRMIAWGSLTGGDVETAGSIHFQPLPNGRDTQVTVSMKYNPPAGKLGAGIASLMGDGLGDKLEEDLQNFKEVMESGLPAVPEIV